VIVDNAAQLLFGNMGSFPAVWMFGLLAFLALWWYVCQDVTAVRRLFLALWLPAALVAGAVYSLDGRGFAVTESLRLLLHRDPAVLAVVHWVPGSGVSATYAMVVGGTVAALATLAVQLAGLLFGGMLGLLPSARLNSPRRPLAGRRPGRPAGNGPRH